MKAHVKINISIHFESEASAAGTGHRYAAEDAKEALALKYPLQAHHAGIIEVKDFSEGERTIVMLNNHVNSVFRHMNVTPATGGHVPELAAAFGGCIPLGLTPPTREEHGLTSGVGEDEEKAS